MKLFLTLVIAVIGNLVWGQTNAPVAAGATNITAQTGSTNVPPAKLATNTNSQDQFTDITSASGHYDGNAHQMIYLGHVLVVDAKSRLACERLTVNMPADGGRPTNVVAETNVAIDMLDYKGQTNHITADTATYTYAVINAVTNEIVIFTGGDPSPKVENPDYTIWGDPLVLNLATKQYGGTNYHMIFKESPAKGTNAPQRLF
jgi:lipopolysaccharide export system protein LptA